MLLFIIPVIYCSVTDLIIGVTLQAPPPVVPFIGRKYFGS